MTASPDTPPTPTPSKKAGERQAFLAAHPHCCFCYGENPTVEIDHVPARTCYIRFTDSSSQNFREEDFQRLFWGVANNAPEAVPQLDAETSRRLQTESRDDIGKPGALIVPRAAHQHLELFATKMLYAIYYRVSGDFAGPRHRRLVTWAQAGTEAATHVAQRSEQWFGDLNVGARSNVDLGDQFHYRQGYNAAHGYLGLSMSFGQSFVFFCVLGPGKQLATLNKLEPKAKRYQPIWQLGLALRKRTP
jgi:hypothetical protein